ncbi:MAG TPA: hypothetical protein VJU16_07030 [Planctomycetota bacterium]|nr:hypothetical protein [Planctomycetota bacterium]
MKLGIDIGRVIIAPGDDNADTSFLRGSLEDALRTPPNEGMFDAVPELVRRFEGRAWLISKCGPKIQDKTRRWLDHHRFFERTGIPPKNLRFCLLRPQKADHCRELGITHFIDDRTDVLEALSEIVPSRFLFGPQKAGRPIPGGVVHVLTWPDALAAIR